ncbi:MAG: DUF4870 domain-containing protein [Candidatus Omnitrophota bacterium]
MSKHTEKTSTGLTANTAAMLSYLAGFITGIIFFVVEKENKFVRFHALQSTFTSGGLLVIVNVLSFIPILSYLVPVLNILGLILWIVLMVKAYQGEDFKLPVIGELVEQNLK